MNAWGFFVFAVGAGVADVGISEGNNLTGIRRISEDLLISRHRGIENHLTNGTTFCAN